MDKRRRSNLMYIFMWLLAAGAAIPIVLHVLGLSWLVR